MVTLTEKKGGNWLRVGSLAVGLGCAGLAGAEIPAERQQELTHLLLQDCGSCHGLTLNGGLGPPLTQEALKDKNPEALADTIRLGRPKAAMPPWGSLLTEAEIHWLVGRMQKGSPP